MNYKEIDTIRFGKPRIPYNIIPTVVLYHKDCSDGFGAAFSAWLAMLDDAEYIATQYQEPPPLDVTGHNVFLLDFSYDEKTMRHLIDIANHVTIIDHHASAQENLENIPASTKFTKVFNMEKSGAVLAWEFFHPKSPIPDFIHYIQDRDLWQWKLHESKEVNEYISSYPWDFNEWWKFIWSESIVKMKAGGSHILRKHFTLVDLFCKKAFEIELAGHKVLCANVPKVYASDVGHKLSINKPFSVTYYDDGETRYVSLRSQDPDGINVKEIAKKFGGGGHDHAAGFSIKHKMGRIYE